MAGLMLATPWLTFVSLPEQSAEAPVVRLYWEISYPGQSAAGPRLPSARAMIGQ
jgi:hypothetical protein